MALLQPSAHVWTNEYPGQTESNCLILIFNIPNIAGVRTATCSTRPPGCVREPTKCPARPRSIPSSSTPSGRAWPVSWGRTSWRNSSRRTSLSQTRQRSPCSLNMPTTLILIPSPSHHSHYRQSPIIDIISMEGNDQHSTINSFFREINTQVISSPSHWTVKSDSRSVFSTK